MKNDFKNYAVNHLGIPSTTLDSYENSISGITAMNTPAIVIEKPTNMQVVSVFDALIKDKIIYVTGTVNDQMANIISAQLLYLDTLNTNEPITLMLNTPGGSVISGLGILDSMGLSKTPIHTTCFALCASMGAVLVSSGMKGERAITRYGRIMIHQASNQNIGGHISDVLVSVENFISLNDLLFDILSENIGKPASKIKDDANRDLWLTSTQALEYGVIDKIYWSKDKVITLENLHEVKK
jgi:ATP-dependent Clp protease protease subunit